MKLFAIVTFDVVELADNRMPLLPHPVVLLCLMSLIWLRRIDPPFTAPAIWMPDIVDDVPVLEEMPRIVLLLIVKFVEFAISMPRKLSLSATTVEPNVFPVISQFWSKVVALPNRYAAFWTFEIALFWIV